MSKEARGTRFLWIWRSGKTRVLADPAEDHGLVSSNHKAAEPQFNPTDSGTLFWPPKVPHTHMVSIQTCRQTHKSLLKRNLSPRLLPASLFLSSSLALSPPLAERSSYKYNKTLLNTLGALLSSRSLRHFLQLGVKGWGLPRFGWDTAMDLCGTDVEVIAGWRLT